MASLFDLESFFSRFGGWDDGNAADEPELERRIQTERTTTVFSGTAEAWVEYLGLPWDARRDQTLDIDVICRPAEKFLRFQPRHHDSAQWATWLNEALEILVTCLDTKPAVAAVLDRLLHGNRSNAATPIHLHATSNVPSEATREVRLDTELKPIETDIVINARVLETTARARSRLKSDAKSGEILGTLWPVFRRVITQLAYPSYPRDRFTERIDLTADFSFVSLHVLYASRENGRLVPTTAGAVYQHSVAASEKIEEKLLFERHPYFRMLNELSFLLREGQYRELSGAVKVAVRDYLDSRYLRISLAGIMPEISKAMVPMRFKWKKKHEVGTPPPQVGRYGILDEEDLNAWRKIHGPLQTSGYVIIRQLGMGQFGRVYEAVNLANSAIPQRVAIKIDRIHKKRKKEAIQAAEIIMDISRGLSHSPHVIRVFDAGKVKKSHFTYHVLQLVDGDTLDNLIGVAGAEHASILRPQAARTSLQELRTEYLKSVQGSTSERWRRERSSLPFTESLTLAQVLDILVSKLLWLEEVHRLGYAINDLKNGNLMLNRRGQLKGIDLDSYSPIFSPLDKMTDFFFLAVSNLMFLLSCLNRGNADSLVAKELLGDPATLRALLLEHWPFGPIEESSAGRVTRQEFTHLAVELINESRLGIYAHEPEKFSRAIDRVIHLKRSLTQEEIVLD